MSRAGDLLAQVHEVAPANWEWKKQGKSRWEARFSVPAEDGPKRVDVEFSAWMLGPVDSLLHTDLARDGLFLNTDHTSVQDYVNRGLDISGFDVDFYVDGSSDKDVEHDMPIRSVAILIYTVGEIVQNFLSRRDPEILSWEPNTEKKGQLYARMVRTWTKKFGNTYQYRDTRAHRGDKAGFLVHKNLPLR